MNEPLRTAIELYEQHGADFNKSLAHCLAFGEVQSCDSYFCMGWPTGDGGFWVQMLAGDMRECLRFNRGRFTKLEFNREFRGDGKPRSLPYESLTYGKRIHTAAAAE